MFFSIVTPTYNRAYLIADTIKSLLAQTFTDFELIIVDDGSTDNTDEVVKTFDDPRIRYYKKINEERGVARNFGIAHAKGQYISFMDSDDLARPHHLQTAYDFLSSTNSEFLHLGYNVIDEEGNVLSEMKDVGPDLFTRVQKTNIMSTNGVFVKREIIKQFPFSTDRKFNFGEDYYVWLRLGARYKLNHLPVVTTSVVQHNSRSMLLPNIDSLQYSSSKLVELLQQDEVIKAKHPDLVNKVRANQLAYLSLCYSLKKEKSKAISYMLNALKNDLQQLFTKRFLVVVSKVLRP